MRIRQKRADPVQFPKGQVKMSLAGTFVFLPQLSRGRVDPDIPFIVGDGIDNAHGIQGQKSTELPPHLIKVAILDLYDLLTVIDIRNIAGYGDLLMILVGVLEILHHRMDCLFLLHAYAVTHPFL